jgi:mono/diheme cytochrome c family protein
MRLFNQSCRVCHTKPQLTSPLYGPELSQNSAGGQEAVMREVISNGTPRMPKASLSRPGKKSTQHAFAKSGRSCA